MCQPEEALAPDALVRPEVMAPLAALLSLLLPEHDPWFTLTPQRQKQQMLETVLAVVLARAAPPPLLFIVEDLH